MMSFLSTLLSRGYFEVTKRAISSGHSSSAGSRQTSYFSQRHSNVSTMANIDTPIPMLKLNDGTSIPMLGYGTGTAWYKSADKASSIDRPTVDALTTALKLGYLHIDAAEVYNTEAEVGIAIKESKIDRSKLYVTTKVINKIANIPQAIDQSLKKLQLDYVDQYLIHAPFFAKSDIDLQTAWTAMETVKASGKAKSIGVSNYLIPHLEATLRTASVKPCLNQIEYHPYLQHAALIQYHKERGIAVSAYSPLSAVTKAKPGPIDLMMSELAKKYYVTENEIALRWCIDSGVVAITTSGKEQRLSDYLRAMTFSLTPREVQEIAEIGDQKHYRGYFCDKFEANDKS